MQDFDRVIKNGTILDGNKTPRFKADLAIKDGRIALIADSIDPGTAEVLDASGCYVAPGQIDVHTHFDAQIHWDPYCTNNGWHGCTSVVLGNCGFGFAPLKPELRERAMLMMTRTEQISLDAMKEGMPITWETFPEWMDNLRNLPKGINVMMLFPLNPALIHVMGLEDSKKRAPNEEEMAQLKALLNEAMDCGAVGFSLQRFGENSLQSDYDGSPMPTDVIAEDTIYQLCDVLNERDEGFVQVQLGTGLIAGDATIDHPIYEEIAARANRPILFTIVTSLDVSDDMETHRKEIEWFKACRERGLKMYCLAMSTRVWNLNGMDQLMLLDTSPAWAEATTGSHEEKMQKLADPGRREALRYGAEHEVAYVGKHWPTWEVAATPERPDLEKYINLNVRQLGEAMDRHPIDALLDLAVETGLQLQMRHTCQTSNNTDVMADFMSNDYILAGASDGGAHAQMMSCGAVATELLTWMVRDNQKMTQEEAHYRLSGLVAEVLGLKDRGTLVEGNYADIMVYELEHLKRLPSTKGYERVEDLPGGDWRYVQRAEGYRWIIVNGEVTFHNGDGTGALPGKLIAA